MMRLIEPLIQFISRNFWRAFWIAFLCILIPAAKLNRDNKYLQLPSSPNGIFSLALADNDSVAQAIVTRWTRDTLNFSLSNRCSCQSTLYNYRDASQSAVDPVNIHRLAIQDVYACLALIPLYILFILIVMTGITNYLRTHSVNSAYVSLTPTMILLTAIPFAAALCDAVSDFAMLQFLRGSQGNTFLPQAINHFLACFKFILLGSLVILYLPVRAYQAGLLIRLTDYGRAKLFQAWRYRVLIIGMVCSAVPIWFMDQGQDLLVNINASSIGVVLFLGIIGFTAMLNWYLAKLFFNNQYQGPVMPYREPSQMPIPDLVKEKKSEPLSRRKYFSNSCLCHSQCPEQF